MFQPTSAMKTVMIVENKNSGGGDPLIIIEQNADQRVMKMRKGVECYRQGFCNHLIISLGKFWRVCC